jgi:hypothetical protein
MDEFDVSQPFLSYLGPRQFYVWRRNVACQDTMEATRQPGGYAACATAEFQARVELRGIHSVAVEPNGETHRILFTAGVEAFGIRSEILLLILLVAANRPKQFGLTLMRPTKLDSLAKRCMAPISTLRSTRIGRAQSTNVEREHARFRAALRNSQLSMKPRRKDIFEWRRTALVVSAFFGIHWPGLSSGGQASHG